MGSISKRPVAPPINTVTPSIPSLTPTITPVVEAEKRVLKRLCLSRGKRGCCAEIEVILELF